MSANCVITRDVVVAGGVFAPGHLGELTRIVPFEMVDAVLAETGRTQECSGAAVAGGDAAQGEKASA